MGIQLGSMCFQSSVAPSSDSISSDVCIEPGVTAITWEVERDNGERKSSRGGTGRVQVI